MSQARLAAVDRRTLWVIVGLAGFALLVTLMILGATIISTATRAVLTIPGALLTESTPYEALSGSQVRASVNQVDVMVAEPPSGIRNLVIGSATASALLPLSMTIAIIILGLTTARERFQRRVGLTFAGLSVAAFAGTIFAPFLNAVAATEALALGPAGTDAPFAFTLSSDMLAVPTLLLVISAVLLLAERMQRDTEGLV